MFLATRLRAQGAELPNPRKFSREQMSGWIAQDKADKQRFREGKRVWRIGLVRYPARFCCQRLRGGHPHPSRNARRALGQRKRGA